jgi:hypothetical protein
MEGSVVASNQIVRFKREASAGSAKSGEGGGDREQTVKVPARLETLISRIASGSVVDLQAAINRFVAETNHDPKPFTWTADPDKIIAAVRRGHQVLDSIH